MSSGLYMPHKDNEYINKRRNKYDFESLKQSQSNFDQITKF